MGINGLLTDVRWEWTGTELTANVLTGATVLPVLDPLSITEGESVWVASTGPYEIVDSDEDGDTFTITPALTLDVDSGTEVANDVGGQPGRAWVCEVVLADSDSPVEVPLTIHDLAVIPEGTYDPPVTIVLSDDLQRVEDLPGSMPVIDGVYIPTETLPPAPPPPPSDGIPPSFSPMPMVMGTIGAIVAHWPAVINADPVTYELHMSTESNFATSAATIYHAGPETSQTVKHLPNHDDMQYGVTYYFKVVARDEDDAAAPSGENSAQMQQVTGPDVAVEYVYAGNIVAGQIVGGTIKSDILVSGNLRTAETGQRVEINSTGITLWAPDGVKVLASFPTDPALPASLKGKAELDSVTINGAMSLRGTNNEIAKDSTLTLSGKVVNPQSSPTVQLGWDFITPWFGPNGQGFNNYRGLAWVSEAGNGVGGWATANQFVGTAGIYIVSAEGSYSDNVTLPKRNANEWVSKVCGLTYLNGFLYVLMWVAPTATGTNAWELRKYTYDWNAGQTGTITLVGYGGFGSQFNAHDPILGDDGTIPIIGWYDATNILRYSTIHPTILGITATTSLATGNPTDLAYMQRGEFDFGAGNLRTMMGRLNPEAMVYGYTTTTRSAVDDFPTAYQTTLMRGASWGPDGRFHVLDGAGKIWAHSKINWTTESNKWWAGFGLYDSDAAGTGQHESGLSAKATFTMLKRANLTLTSPTIPDNGGADDPDSVRWYLGRGASIPGDGTMFRQATSDPGITSVTLISALFSGSTAPLNNFPSSGAAKITDAAGNTLMDATGYMMAAPTGAVQMYAGAAAPPGWLLCQGQTVSRTAYAALFAAIGTTYNVGTVANDMFMLPDLMRRFPYGATNDGLLPPGTSDPDTTLAARQTRQYHNHTHSDTFATGAAGSVANARGSGAFSIAPDAHTHAITGAVGAVAGSAAPYMHPMMVLNFLIKT